jgi:hypothetical protein
VCVCSGCCHEEIAPEGAELEIKDVGSRLDCLRRSCARGWLPIGAFGPMRSRSIFSGRAYDGLLIGKGLAYIYIYIYIDIHIYIYIYIDT